MKEGEERRVKGRRRKGRKKRGREGNRKSMKGGGVEARKDEG